MEFSASQRDSLQLIELASAESTVVISRYGGQVLSFIPTRDRRERLFLSDRAVLDGSKSIRGGIPVCWPWFGAHPAGPGLPAHGFVRNRIWSVVDEHRDDNGVRIVLEPGDTTGPGLQARASLRLVIHASASLTLQLVTTNTGDIPLPLSCALHSYFAVGDINGTELSGLTGAYSDKTREWQHFDTPAPYRFVEETDRIHLHPAPRVIISCPLGQTSVVSEGHDSIVVWNPWTRCAENFPDMRDTGYREMLCVETALTQGLVLEPGAQHTLTQTIA
jgi:glucose-6-phosphate 1-epimerase